MATWGSKFIFIVGLLVASSAQAQICSTSLPYTFVNGTVADGTQVNANFQAIIACVNANAAKSGVNSDITALNALPAGSLVQSGQIAYFNMSSCPSGWTNSDGTSSTLDLRGYFIRSLNLGSGHDPANPGLGVYEAATNGSVTGNVSSSGYNSLGVGGSFSGSGSFTVNSSGTTGTVIESINAGGSNIQPGSGWGWTSGNASVSVSGSSSVNVSGGISGSASGTVSVSGGLSCTNCGAEARPQSVAAIACQKL